MKFRLIASLILALVLLGLYLVFESSPNTPTAPAQDNNGIHL
jgi:hypothetical protein